MIKLYIYCSVLIIGNVEVGLDKGMKFHQEVMEIVSYDSPIYVCTVHLQTWFRTSVQDVANLIFKSQLEKRTYLECSQGYISADSKEWLCNTCRLAIKKEQWPKLSIINGMGSPSVPRELQLYGMEECIICPRLVVFPNENTFHGWLYMSFGQCSKCSC